MFTVWMDFFKSKEGILTTFLSAEFAEKNF
ncbi:hypothetical protein BH10BAC1_BH10BAC1_07710 [soil metagenome]